ncbi:hypothetical protein [Endozoicomonas numazuensis]|uniref:Uncharacterized protein n=1 Tax=Endozoicomonas numazuensis TaxID=1137799 RepID=A0A081NEX5_9GAMM|nr:hypothetical protein [Endozoicomonas numazuensis]KEQ16998.1 hypothetical protein GZ78_20475 [Endozoicomonas numazuensis]
MSSPVPPRGSGVGAHVPSFERPEDKEHEATVEPVLPRKRLTSDDVPPVKHRRVSVEEASIRQRSRSDSFTGMCSRLPSVLMEVPPILLDHDESEEEDLMDFYSPASSEDGPLPEVLKAYYPKIRKEYSAEREQPTEFLKYVLNTIDADMSTNGEFLDVYEDIMEETLTHRAYLPAAKSGEWVERDVVKLGKKTIGHIKTLGIKEPTHSRDTRWPYMLPYGVTTEDDRRYIHKLNPVLNLCDHVAFHEEKTLLTDKQRNHLYSQLVSYIVSKEKLAKCGDFSHVAATYLLPKLAERMIPARLAMMNMEFSGKKSLNDKNENVFEGNHITLLLVPVDDDFDGDMLDHPDALIIDPMLGTIRKNNEKAKGYARYVEAKLNFPPTDKVEFSYVFFDGDDFSNQPD